MAHAVVGWNYTTWLNLVAILVASVLFFASRRKRDAP
jgi:hypothetical protein